MFMDCRGRHRMVIAFTTTCAISVYQCELNPVHGDVIQLVQYRIYIGSSIMQTSEFRVLGFGIGASSNRIPIVVSLHIMFPEQILSITRSTLRFANCQLPVS